MNDRIPEPPRSKTPEEIEQQRIWRYQFDFADRYVQKLGHHHHTLLGIPGGAVSHWTWDYREGFTISLHHRGWQRVLQWNGMICSQMGHGDVEYKSGDGEKLHLLMDEIQRRFA